MMKYPPGVVFLTTEARRGKLTYLVATDEEKEARIARYSEEKSDLITQRTIVEYLLKK